MFSSGPRISAKAALTSLLLAGFATLGALAPVALPLRLERQFTATASLNVILPGQTDLAEAVPSKLYQPEVLAQIAEELGWSGQDIRSRQGVFDFLNDLLTGEAMTIDRSEASLRQRLQTMLTPLISPDHRTVTVLAKSAEAEEAAKVANASAEVLKRLFERETPPQTEQNLTKLREDLQQAEAAKDALGISEADVASFQQDQNQRTVLAVQKDDLGRQQDMLNARAQALAKWKASDFAGRVLPEELQALGLDAQRQRLFDAQLKVQQLSASLGPKHPTLMAAEGAANEARTAVAKAVTALIAETNRQLGDVKVEDAQVEKDLIALTAKPVSVALREHVALEKKIEDLRKIYLDAMRAERREVKPAALILPLQPAKASEVSVSGLPLWVYSVLGGLAGLCLGGACLPGRREIEAKEEIQTEADDAYFDIEPQIMPDVVPVIEVATSEDLLARLDEELLEPSVPMRIAVAPSLAEDDVVDAETSLTGTPSLEDFYPEENQAEDETELSIEAMLDAVANDDRSHGWLRELIMANIEPLGNDNRLPPLMETAFERVEAGAQQDELAQEVAELQVLLEQLSRMREVLAAYPDFDPVETENEDAAKPHWRHVA